MVENTDPKIMIVGCGPGSPELLTRAGSRAIREADVLVGTARLLDTFAAKQQEKIPAGANIEAVLNTIAERRKTQKVAILVTGDPGLCSLARPVLRRFGLNACDVLPGISSVQVAFARLGLDWLDARILSAHAQLPQATPRELAAYPKLAILAGHRDALAWMANLHAQLGERCVYVCEDLSLETERIRRIPPGDLPFLKVSPRTIVLFINEKLLS